jgi:hypothetical protein
LIVACVLRSGGIYTPEWVQRLQNGVGRHLTGHRFICLSDVPVPCERIPLVTDWPSWWAKIEMFRLKGPVLYLDLDSVIVGDLAPLFREELTGPADFNCPGQLQGSVLSWGGDCTAIWDRFRADPDWRKWDALGIANGGLDQGFIASTIKPRFYEPGLVVSYKKHCRGSPPDGARVVQFHGIPKMTDVSAPWVAENWC